MIEKELCRTLALGSLVRGYFHNLRGTLQNLSFQLQLLYLKKETYLSPQARPYLEKALEFLQKLENQLNVALEDLQNENPGPWDLKEIMEKELLFWEANLFFKHKVKKEVLEKNKVLINLPLRELKGLLCLLEERLYSLYKEGSSLKIILGEEGRPNLIFETDSPLSEEELSQIKSLSPYFEPYALLRVSPERIELEFKNS